MKSRMLWYLCYKKGVIYQQANRTLPVHSRYGHTCRKIRWLGICRRDWRPHCRRALGVWSGCGDTDPVLPPITSLSSQKMHWRKKPHQTYHITICMYKHIMIKQDNMALRWINRICMNSYRYISETCYLDSMRGTLGLFVPGPVGLHLIV